MKKKQSIGRREFLRKGSVAASAAIAMPYFIPASALGRGAAVAPSERITLGAIGIGGRGSGVLNALIQEDDVQGIAVCDLKSPRLQAAKNRIDQRNGNTDCATHKDFRDLLARDDIDAVMIATGPNWHSTISMMAAQAGKDIYCEKPCTKNIADSLQLRDVIERTGRVFQGGMQRRNVPQFTFCATLARTGKLGPLKEVHFKPSGRWGVTGMTGWLDEDALPEDPQFDWDMYLGPAAWRPFNTSYLRGGNFEKGGGMIGPGVMEWGSHSVDQCQLANTADQTVPLRYFPKQDGVLTALYANGVKMVARAEGWDKRLGSCPVKYVGEEGWVETGDSGTINSSAPGLVAARGKGGAGTNPGNHARDFINCVKMRGLPATNHHVSCHSHIACANMATAELLERELSFDPVKMTFIDDAEANRFRSEARREPWSV